MEGERPGLPNDLRGLFTALALTLNELDDETVEGFLQRVEARVADVPDQMPDLTPEDLRRLPMLAETFRHLVLQARDETQLP